MLPGIIMKPIPAAIWFITRFLFYFIITLVYLNWICNCAKERLKNLRNAS